ncbi:MAG: amidohydrolase family protein, partial [Rubrivivax sp.]|nr:amidohydrolase family protein [Rubrivivax sp.]
MNRLSSLRHAALAGLLVFAALATAQTGAEPFLGGLRDNTPRWHAITGARLVLAPGQVVDNGTLVMKDGVIVAAGANVPVPAGARVWSLPGRTVHAGFIDLASSLGVPGPFLPAPPPRPAQLPALETPPLAPRPMSQRSSASKSRFLRAEQDMAAQLESQPEPARTLRELGLLAVMATPQAGVWRGQGALVATGEAGDAKAAVITPRAAQHLAFEINRLPDNAWPTSLMGAIAMARQSLHDARWQRAAASRSGAERVEANATLAALAPVLDARQPVIFAAFDEQDAPRLARLRDEFGLRAVLHGTGFEYRRVQQVLATKLPVIVPLTFPAAPVLADPDGALDVPLATLQHWEQAPSNAAVLHRAGVPLAVTAFGLRDARTQFWPRLREAVRRGWPAEAALAALTTAPAEWLGESARLGTLAPGRIANVVVSRGDLFASDEAVIELLFVDGRPLPTEAFERSDPRGTWAVDGETWQVTGSAAQPKLQRDGGTCDLQPRGREWIVRLPCGKAAEAAGLSIVAEPRGELWVGTAQQGLGPLRAWQAKRVAAAPAASAPASEEAPVPPPRASYPAGAFGIGTPERPALLLVKNATVWTQGPAGKLANADLLVREGRIAAVGPNLAAPAGAWVIDASGKHVTPGLIDAHSHTAIARSVNEFGAAVSAEVRVGDALDATDIDLYRQLAGGLTTANLLHGSANAIGGQSQVIKLRWGASADGLRFEGAQPAIKFALGENVKNWGPRPATRMGTEQLLRDRFLAAQEYAAAWRAHRASPKAVPEPRRELQLETLVEILERRRAVHIHSYRADEILMFVRLAQELNIEVAAFQHVLEGYKVADAIASIGAGGSTFSDWWNYKMEVTDAIPFNGALMHRAGVLTSFNSDDGELARRMNTEAAKAMKYGRLSETEALALVTINPARQLRVDARTGSLEAGKDADFVIWNAHPLSTYAKAEQTWIDGRRYFDLETDRRLREEAAAERARLVTAVLRAPRPPAAP